MFSYTLSAGRPLAHPERSGDVALSMLKYRYPGWIEKKNYK